MMENLKYVHHILVFICPKDSTIETDGICDEIASSFFGCFGGQIISAWAVGGEVLLLHACIDLDFISCYTYCMDTGIHIS